MRLSMGALIVGAVLLTVPSWSPAAEDEEGGGGGPSRFYATAGGLASMTNYDLPTDTGQQSSWGVDARFGYRVFSVLAVEGQYQWAARAEITNGLGQQANVVETHTGTVNAKVLPFQGPFQPYLLLGFGGFYASQRHGHDSLETALRVGGGVNLFFTDHVGIYGEVTYLHPFGSLDGLATVPIAFGGIFQF
jgi:hypothetical protein